MSQNQHLRGVATRLILVVAENEKQKAQLFILTDKIAKAERSTLSEEERVEAASAYKQIMESILKYFEDKFASKDTYLTDICGEEQFIYGKAKTDDSNHWYLVDTDPLYTENRNLLRYVLENYIRQASLAEVKLSLDLGELKKQARALHQKVIDEYGEEEQRVYHMNS